MTPSQTILRSLRTSCNSLSAYSKERVSGVSATYSSRPTNTNPPLFVLPPPDSRAYYDRSLCEQRELARKIYAVRDAYNSVLARTRDEEGPAPRVMSLADMCAAVAGRGLEWEPDDDSTVEDMDEWDEEVAEIYEAIPAQYRRAAIRSQALDIILSQCPHHITLLSLLLDTALAHALACEAPDLLRLLIHQAVRPRRATSPALLHPSHTLFLVDLLRRWTTACAERSHLTFVQALLDVTDEHTPSDIWTSKAMDKLARELGKHGLPCFLQLSGGLLSHATHPKSFALDNAVVQALESQLHGWMTLASRHCFRKLMVMDTIFEDDADYESVYDFLRTARPMLANCRTRSSTTQGVICLGTEWLTAMHTHASKRDTDAVCALVRRLVPTQDAFQPILAMPFADVIFADHVGPVDWLGRVAGAFSARANVLRKCGLTHAEAMLWSGALREIERPVSERAAAARSCEGEVRRWRDRLIALADEAEGRCRGGLTTADWARENMVDCWEDSRPAKRVKRAHTRVVMRTPARKRGCGWERCGTRDKGITREKKVVRFRASSDTEEDSENLPTRRGKGDEDESDCLRRKFSSPYKKFSSPRRRFSSILSSALTNMTSVHTPKAKKQRMAGPERHGELDRPAGLGRPIRPMPLRPAIRYPHPGVENLAPPQRWRPTVLLSDDPLDVFHDQQGAFEDLYDKDDSLDPFAYDDSRDVLDNESLPEEWDNDDSFDDGRFVAPSSDDPLDMFIYQTSPVRS